MDLMILDQGPYKAVPWGPAVATRTKTGNLTLQGVVGPEFFQLER